MKTLYLSLIVGLTLCLAQGQDNHLQAGYDPQLLSYQLQQLALQQYSAAQSAQPQQLDLQQYSGVQYTQSQQYNTQPQQYSTQPVQFPPQSTQGVSTQARQQVAQYLQQSLFQPAYDGQFANSQNPSQATQTASLQAGQQLPKQNLLGVAYSSAADASRTSFTGYGVKYSF